MTIKNFGHFAPLGTRFADFSFRTLRVGLSKNPLRFGSLDLQNLGRPANRIFLSLFVLKIFKVELFNFSTAAAAKPENSTLNILTKIDRIILCEIFHYFAHYFDQKSKES